MAINNVQPLIELVSHVNNFDEFAAHFNFEKGILNEEEAPTSLPYTREQLIESLFDNSDPRTDSAHPEFETYKNAKTLFIKNVVSKNLLIAKDTNLYVNLFCTFILNSQPTRVSLIMKYVLDGEDAYRWAINKVETESLNISGEYKISEYISPVSDNLGFMNLEKHFQESNSVNLAENKFIYNKLSVFFFLIESGTMRFKQVNKMTYYYYGLSGWEIQLQEFNRSHFNSGWLISDLKNRKEH